MTEYFHNSLPPLYCVCNITHYIRRRPAVVLPLIPSIRPSPRLPILPLGSGEECYPVVAGHRATRRQSRTKDERRKKDTNKEAGEKDRAEKIVKMNEHCMKGPLLYCFSSMYYRSQIYTEHVSEVFGSKHQTDHCSIP